MPFIKQGRAILAGALIIASAMVGMISLKAEEIVNKEMAVTQEQKVKVFILTTDVVEDQSWGSLAYKGMLQIEDQFPIEAELISGIKSEGQIKEKVKQAVQNKAKMIIGHGREFGRLFDEMASVYPNVQFAHLNGESKKRNHTGYIYNQSRMEQIAALAASMKTKTNKIGLIDAQEDRIHLAGFEEGLKQFAPNAEFYYRVVGNWENGEKAVGIAKEMVKQGVDVLYSRGNGFNRAVIDYAAEQGVFIIGYMDDQSYMGEQVVLTSVTNDISQAYIAMLNDYFSDTGMPSGTVVLTEKDGMYSLAPLGPMFTENEKNRIQAEINQLN